MSTSTCLAYCQSAWFDQVQLDAGNDPAHMRASTVMDFLGSMGLMRTGKVDVVVEEANGGPTPGTGGKGQRFQLPSRFDMLHRESSKETFTAVNGQIYVDIKYLR
jgi:hypothetical protein